MLKWCTKQKIKLLYQLQDVYCYNYSFNPLGAISKQSSDNRQDVGFFLLYEGYFTGKWSDDNKEAYSEEAQIQIYLIDIQSSFKTAFQNWERVLYLW